MTIPLKKTFTATFLLLSFCIVLLFSGITIPLDSLDSQLSTLTSNILGRQVTLQGKVRLKLSLQPTLEFGKLSIGNPRDWNDDSTVFLTVQEGLAQVSMLPLLRGDIRVNDLQFSGLNLHLVTREDHSTNFNFASSDPKPEQPSGSHELTGLDHLSMHDIQISYLDELSGKQYELKVDEAHGKGLPNSSLHFAMHGTVLGQPCSLDFTGGSLHDLLQGKENWPLTDGSLTLADIALDLGGSVDKAEPKMAGSVALSLKGRSLDGIEEMFGITMPDIGEFSLNTRLSIHPGKVHCSGFQIEAMNSSLLADLMLSLHGRRPTLAGNITIPFLDPVLFSVFKNKKSEANPAGSVDVPEISENKTQFPLPWLMLQLVDADIHFRVNELHQGDNSIQNLHTVVSLFNGDLFVPLSLTVLDTEASGYLEIVTTETVPSIDLAFDSKGMDLAPLSALAGQQQFSGQLGSLNVNAKTQGKSVQELIAAFDLNLNLGASKLFMDSEPLLTTSALSFKRSTDKTFALLGEGRFMERPFKLDAHTGKAVNPKESSSVPLHLQLEACDSKLLFDGNLHPEQQKSLADFQFSLQGSRLCGFMEPVENFMGKGTDFSGAGKGTLLHDGWTLDLPKIRLGNVAVDIKAKQQPDKQGKPLITAAVHSKSIDLSPFLHKDGKKENKKHKKGNSGKDKKDGNIEKQNRDDIEQKTRMLKALLTQDILPQKRLLATNAKLKLHLEKMDTGQGSISNIKVATTITDGKITDSPFQASIGDSLFSGNAQLDMIGDHPAIHLELTSKDFNLPKLFKEFQLDRAPELTADHINMDLTFKGRNMQELLGNSSQKVTIKNGRFLLPRKFHEPLLIAVKRAEYVSKPNKPAVISLTGSVNSQPLTLQLSENGLFAGNSNKPWTLSLQVEVDDSKLAVAGKVIRKKGAGNSFDLTTSLSGQRLDKLNKLLGVDLPPLGPYSVKGAIHLQGDTFTFHDVAVQVGNSTLNGEMILSGRKDKKGNYMLPVTLKTKLEAKTIQLNDFQLGKWSPLVQGQQKETVAVDTGKDAGKNDKNDKNSENKLNNLFSPELAAKVDGSIIVDVQEVVSGRDKLGSGHLQAKIAGGVYSLDSLRLDIPGGAVQVQGLIRPETDKVEARLGMQINHLDYGILTRRVQPESDLKGELNLNLDVHAKADTVMQLKEHLNGQLRFGVVPEEFKAGVIDLWAVNILASALPAMLDGSKSEVNCLAGDFRLQDGIMQPNVFLLDTTEIRVQGEGEVNFKTNGIDFYLNPTPKSAHFFSMATPINVSGTIDDYHIGVTAEGVITTVFQQAASVVTIPFQWLFAENLEADGSKACSAAMEWVKTAEE